MAQSSITVTVEQHLGADMKAYKGKLKLAVSRAMRQEGETTMTEAKSETPVETGALRASGLVDGPHTEGDVIILELGFGGSASDYALIVHERMDVHHPVGKAKYLEDPCMRMADRLPNAIARAASV